MAFKIQLPKEMKIRLGSNIAAMIIAFVNAGYAAWYLAVVLNYSIQNSIFLIHIVFAILSVAGAGLYFLMAKIMWALQKKTKQMGKLVLVIFGVLGIVGGFFGVLFGILNEPDFGTVWYWSVLVGFTAGIGFLIVAAKMIGEIMEKLKNLIYFGFAGIAGLVIVIVVVNFLANSSKSIFNSAVQVAGLGTMVASIAGIIFTILGYWAEAALIKKKFLVYS